MERRTERIENSLDNDQLENFHEFMRAYTDIFTNNIFTTKDYAYHNLKDISRRPGAIKWRLRFQCLCDE